jgi:hypothetical protein
MIFPIFADFLVSFCECAFFFSFGQLPPKVFNFNVLGFGLGFEASFIFFHLLTRENKILSFSRPSFLSSITSERRLFRAIV